MRSSVIALLEIAGVVFLRFRPVPRIWAIWLVAVNVGCLAFIAHIEAQVVLAVTAVALGLMTQIYRITGFTRILGVAHVLWVPMFAWIASRWDGIALDPAFAAWMTVLFVTNAIGFSIDTIDAIRFWRGERDPHYTWARPHPV